MFDSQSWAIRGIVVAITMQLTRVSIDLIQVADKAADDKDKKLSQKDKPTGDKDAEKPANSEPPVTSDLEQPLLATPETLVSDDRPWWLFFAIVSLLLQAALIVALLVVSEIYKNSVFAPWLLGSTALVVALGALASWRDIRRERFGFYQKVFYCLGALSMCLAYECVVFANLSLAPVDKGLMIFPHAYLVLTLFDCFVTKASPTVTQAPSGKKMLSFGALSTLLKPYFWPDATSDTAISNRVRAILTWVCVFLNKACNLSAPLFLGWASTALAHLSYNKCIKLSICYCVIKFFGSTMRECQSLLYLKVSQAAFVQLSEQTFEHLLSLSLDWHLRKKLGETIRNMDRGIAGCDTLMKYVFLWLLPALAECILVCVIFALYFQYAPLAITVFFFVYVYIVLTIVITLWRKQFRKAVNKSDNDWHDKSTDALINIETVKCFTAEIYEKKRFGKAVSEYQKGSVNLQASLSFLNISQQFFMQTCLATSLALATIAIKSRGDCCVNEGCGSLISECCLAMSFSTCPGMNVGDYVAVLTYTLNLFAPLNFLGSVYNAIVTAVIDLSNLAELLAENLDVTDAPDALPMPLINEDDPDIAVEFDNVIFRYPTQPADKGLKGLSFKLKRGTTTAIVGPTGAGKTTVSRLLFRFYDVGGGAVKVNGVDVRSVSQASLRGTLGIVPQAASMFNDTIKHNLLYGKRDATQEELEQVVEDAQLTNFIEALDEKYESMVGDRGLKLSGGEKQRAAIARCLLKDPPIVLLDEATSALDTLTENSVQEALDRLGTERTVLVIAHRLGTIRNADNIVVLKDGVVHEQGTHDELLSKPNGVYADMWNMQLHSTASSDNLEF